MDDGENGRQSFYQEKPLLFPVYLFGYVQGKGYEIVERVVSCCLQSIKF